MQLHSLLEKIHGVLSVSGDAQLPFRAITSDSRNVADGTLFIAVKGVAADGNIYVSNALSSGASGVVSELPRPENLRVNTVWVQVENSRRAVCDIAAAWYHDQPEYVVAVTGTDGKTSTADFYRQIASIAGKHSASIGTLGVLGASREYPALNTTPDPILLHRTLSELAGECVSHVALEASSHGLDQHRLHGVQIHAAAFTNLSRDHLDYHQTMERYFEAKLKLFTEVLKPGGLAVINADTPYFSDIASACKSQGKNVASYGKSAQDYVLRSIRPVENGLFIDAVIQQKPYSFVLPMVGSFQAYNFMAALGMCNACGIDTDIVIRNIHELKGVPGRLEQVASHPAHGAPIFIDYAHTPAALENILKILRPHIEGKLHVVFGCGGDRDTGKRPQMGLAAVAFADAVVVTDDNPRSENPQLIRDSIFAPMSSDQKLKARNIGDRKEAIAFAIQSLQKGDGLVIAGKGHEKTQTIGTRVIPFDDADVAKQIVTEIRK
jgi:UDP-N-acetylmuramoyl-L-alanyl-D-glutamate--2,6-diaminopimelate ligase